MQGGSKEYDIIDASADVSSRCESIKRISELIPCIYYNSYIMPGRRQMSLINCCGNSY